MISRETALELLGIEDSAAREDIKREFRRASKDLYPGSPGEDRDRWELLLEARDVLLGQKGNSDLLPVRVARELAQVQERALARIDERHERAAATEGELRSVVLRQTSHLDRVKRAAWAASVLAGGIAVSVALLRAVVLTGPTSEQNAVFATLVTGFAIAAAVCGVFGFAFRTRSEHLSHAIEDVTNQLSQRAQYLRVLSEIKRATDQDPPWTADAFDGAIREWTNAIGQSTPGSLASTAIKIGASDFGRLLVAKGLELGVLIEVAAEDDGKLTVIYEIADLQKADARA